MIHSDDILNINFYKKEKFTGSYQGMHYLIQKDKDGESDVFRVFQWPGPYNFTTTDDSLKVSACFPFTTEGREQVVSWLNEQWDLKKNEWPPR